MKNGKLFKNNNHPNTNGKQVEDKNNASFKSACYITGISCIAISLLADILGLGTAPDQFGVIQIAGTTTGVILIVLGFVYKFFSRN